MGDWTDNSCAVGRLRHTGKKKVEENLVSLGHIGHDRTSSGKAIKTPVNKHSDMKILWEGTLKTEWWREGA